MCLCYSPTLNNQLETLNPIMSNITFEKSGSYLLNLRAIFYLVTPNETSHQTMKGVPNFVDQAVPYLVLMIMLESIVLQLQGKDKPRINNGVNSMSHGLLSQLHSTLFRPVGLVMYAWIYWNWKLMDLPWDNPWTWFLGLICVDFFYYWFHRFSHESSILWAAHQVHHSSEDYNMTTSFRQSLVQRYFNMFSNMPMALCVPPSIFYVHQQFNLLYQFWLHTEVIKSLGPLEYILNTPSHHRVHHGRNPYCLNKNFGGTFIIWDRIFNTFEPESEQVVYGLVHPNQFWAPLYGQFFQFMHILGLVKKKDTSENKVPDDFKEPGLEPVRPERELNDVHLKVELPVKKYDSNLPTWASVYVLVHYALVAVSFSRVVGHKHKLTDPMKYACTAYFIFSVTAFGALFDHRNYSFLMESVRCVLFLILHQIYTDQLHLPDCSCSLHVLFLASALLWAGLALFQRGPLTDSSNNSCLEDKEKLKTSTEFQRSQLEV